MNAEWRAIPGFPNYQVSSDGRVVSLHRWRGRTGRELAGTPSPKGYLMVTLCGPDGVQLRRGIHQFVALAFLGPRPDGMEIRHLDGNNQNNAVSNLAYGTAVDNARDRMRHGTAWKTHCIKGHLFDEKNTRRSANRPWKRICIACEEDYNAARRARRAQASTERAA